MHPNSVVYLKQAQTAEGSVDRNMEKLNTLAGQLLETYDEQVFIYSEETNPEVYYDSDGVQVISIVLQSQEDMEKEVERLINAAKADTK